MEELIKAVEREIKSQEGLIKYHADKLKEHEAYHSKAGAEAEKTAAVLKSQLISLKGKIAYKEPAEK